MTTLLPSDRQRLAKLLGLLGSDHQGERDNAGRAAHQLVQQHGMTWFDVVAPDSDAPSQPRDDPVGPDWRRAAAARGRYQHRLNAWEAHFLAGLPRFPRITRRQRDVLINIAVRLRACGCRL